MPSLDILQQFNPHYMAEEVEELWWSEALRLSLWDREQWARIQDIMAENRCFIEVKAEPGAQWVQVDPVPEFKQESRAEGVASGTDVQQGGVRRATGRRTGSSLRNEVAIGD